MNTSISTTTPTLNTVHIKKGTRFGKEFTGTFHTKDEKLKRTPNKEIPGSFKYYCSIIDTDSEKSLWIAIASEDDVEFCLVAKPPVEDKVPQPVVVLEESEEQILDRIRDRFAILHRLVRGVCCGAIKALIVSGPAGVGKSFGVETELAAHAALSGYKYEFIKGTASAIYLYQKLWEFKDERSILVFDDCDSIFYDSVSLNILKAALDSSRRRVISWGTNSRILNELKIDNSFEFKGAIIFITNLKFDKVRSEALRDHLAALESRCHYLDLTIDTARDKVLRIKQVVRDSALLSEYGFSKEKAQEIVDYVAENMDNLRELSLRTVKKVADLAAFSHADWKSIAKVTCQKPVKFNFHSQIATNTNADTQND